MVELGSKKEIQENSKKNWGEKRETRQLINKLYENVTKLL